MQPVREYSTIAYGFCSTYQALLIQSVYRCALFSVALCFEESETKNWDMQLIYTKVGCSVLSVMSVMAGYCLFTIMLAVVHGFVVTSFMTLTPWTTASSSFHVPTRRTTRHYTSSKLMSSFVNAVSSMHISNESVNLLYQ
jgi:hypothetical protein